ncbi:MULTISPECIES: SGNH/GDSL hydrolase family protein [Spirulina sp. CCY15215]|uniref:SGNH/GDSL hydrolase family protein n=1 Tax=Spirulina sp. CCY15215 TaxID=2767591 RepID=UPI00195117E3|nr:SGNH/GDSL hydrolase family protein [Spirulina major]
MFKSYRNPYYNRRKRPSISWWKLLLFVALSLVLLEALTRITMGLLGYRSKLANYAGAPEEFTAYTLNFLNLKGKTFGGLPDRGQLLAVPDFATGYRLAGKQTSEFWQINEQGFRDDEPLPLEKPANEIRIFILGDSTAFGQGIVADPEKNLTANQKTIAYKLQTRLQTRLEQQNRSPEKYRPSILPVDSTGRVNTLRLPPKIRGGNYRVINAAVPGYTSGNQLAQLALEILPYKPDVVIVLHGYSDLMLPQEQQAAEIPKQAEFLNNPPQHFWTYLSQSGWQFLTGTSIYKSLQYFVLKPEPSLARETLAIAGESQSLEEHLPENETELEFRVDRYRQNLKQMIQIGAGSNIPLIIALQPEITGISPEKRQEKEDKTENQIVQELGSVYQQKIATGFTRLGAVNEQLGKAFPKNAKVLNYYQLFDNLSAVAFIDAVHLTDAGNQALSERFYNAVTALPDLQIIAQTPRR